MKTQIYADFQIYISVPLNEQRVQLATWPCALKFQETSRAGKKEVFFDIFRCFPKPERIEIFNKIA